MNNSMTMTMTSISNQLEKRHLTMNKKKTNKMIIEHVKESRVRPMPFVKDVFMCKMICFLYLSVCVCVWIDVHHHQLIVFFL